MNYINKLFLLLVLLVLLSFCYNFDHEIIYLLTAKYFPNIT